MKQSFLLPVLFLTLLSDAIATTDKYRLILVDDPTSTITVAWNQITGVDPVVYYDVVDHGMDFSQYAHTGTVDRSTSYKGMSSQFVRLTGLSPNSDYYFVIKDSDSTSDRFWFRTAPDDNSRLSFLAGGDSRNNRVPRQNANKLVGKLKPHAVFFGGDMTDDETDTEWQNWFDDWQHTTSADGRMIPIVPARGNHEDPNSVFFLFDTPTRDTYYAITWGDNLIRTYTLNSEISVQGNQLTWLENDLINSNDVIWKMAQYHKPMRPHTASKSEGNAEYAAWANLFYDHEVRLVIDCDSHMAKTTWPIKPSSDPGNDEGFVIDEKKGTVYTGEGAWGAPLRPNDDDKSWTRSSGSFNQFKVIFIDEEMIELRTIDVNNADEVAEGSNEDPFTLPQNLDVFDPPTGAVVVISKDMDNPCFITGTPCDDGDDNTSFDEEDGYCQCIGLPNLELVEATVSVNNSSDDAEEFIQTGSVDLSSSDLELVNDGAEQIIGIRFGNIQIPEGATLYRSYIQFQTDEIDMDQDPTNLVIRGELSPSSQTFEEALANISSRPLTDHAVLWNEIQPWETIGEAGLLQRTPYVTQLVQEMIEQPGWTQGNALSFIISGTGKRVAEAFDGDGGPVLKLFYQSPCDPIGTPCDDGDINTIFDIEDGSCNCIGIPELGIQTYQVDHGDDDAEEAEVGGAMYVTSSDLELVFDSFDEQNNQSVGIRFNNIFLPQGAIILNARLQFTVDESDGGPVNLIIRGEKTADSKAFTDDELFNISLRNKTEAMVSWNAIPAWNTVDASGPDQRSPDIRSVVQEIINQEDWQPFNSMSFIINGNGVRTAESFNGSAADAPQLIIEYLYVTTQTADEEMESGTRVYPNPAGEKLYIESQTNIDQVIVFNLQGQEMLSRFPDADKIEIKTGDWASGIYLVYIMKGDRKEVHQVFVR